MCTSPRIVLHFAGPSHKFKASGSKFLQWAKEAFQSKEFVGLKSKERRSFVYVEDVCSVILALVARHFLNPDASFYGTYNVGGPESLSRVDVVRSMCAALGATLTVAKQGSGDQADQFTSGAAALACTDEWKVYIMDETDEAPELPPVPMPSSTSLVSPKDITMDSSRTETGLSFAFSTIESVLAQCLLY
jgi:nucleoside-diphosphate-sugar epimerase